MSGSDIQKIRRGTGSAVAAVTVMSEYFAEAGAAAVAAVDAVTAAAVAVAVATCVHVR